MSNIDKQALREEFQYMQHHYSDPADRDRQIIYIAAEALLDELEKEKGYASAYEGEKWHYHQLAESEGERADLAEVKLEAAEKRNAELEARTVTLPQYRKSPDMHTKQFYEAIGFNQGLDIFIEALRAAGIGVKGD